MLDASENLKGRQTIERLRAHYRSGHDDLGKDFFLPCLGQASWYRRAAGYFSSSALLSWAAILPRFVSDQSRRIDLLISPELTEPDKAALRRVATEADRDRVRQDLADNIVINALEFATAPEDVALRIKLFTWMIASGQLTLRFAFPHHVENARLFHEKIGLFTFPWGATVAFTGSANETEGGHSDNYESIDVFRDWVPADAARVLTKERQFLDAWSGLAPGLRVLSLSPRAMSLVRTNASYSSSPGGTSRQESRTSDKRWKHQDDAIKKFIECERGVLEMATGTGKTRTALRLIQHLAENNCVQTVVVAMDGNDLLDQWYKQLAPLSQRLGRPFRVLRHHGPHKERDQFLLDPTDAFLLASRPNLRVALCSLTADQGARTLLIHDEVHRLGSQGNRTELIGLSDRIRFRLGLSATPEREYDKEGSDFIEKHIGPVIFRFGLEDAIQRGILAPFDYHPVEWRPSGEDRERIQQVYKRAAAREAAGSPMSQADIWIELSNVYKTSEVKIPLFRDFVRARPDLLERCIIFVATTEYGDAILDLVHKHRHDFHTYFAEDKSETLRRFARGDLECLITCHRLSEGIDIQSLKSVILLSSDRARLETIQRIGRCLRLDPENPAKRAQVVDFVRVRDQGNFDSDPTPDELRRDWLSELSSLTPEVSP